MKSSHFEKLILNRIHRSIDRIVFLAAVISLISAVAVYFSAIPVIFAWADLLIGTGLFMIYLYKNKIDPMTKVFIVVLIPILLGIATFTDGGFTSGTVILILIGNATAMLLLRRSISLFLAGTSLIGMIILWIWTYTTGFQAAPAMTSVKWLIQILLMILFLFIFRISVYAIKNFLIENIEELEESVELTRKLAYYDTLTGLPNYNYFMEYFNKSVTKNEQMGIILIISLKNLNVINAIYGNESGNLMLQKTGRALKEAQSQELFAARVSSNEFAVWITELGDRTFIESKILALLNMINVPDQLQTHSHTIEFYASYARLNLAKETIESGYQRAQVALTYAKYMDSEKLVAYDEAFDQKIKRTSDLKELLKKEIEVWEQIRLYYQPQITGKSEKITCVEALSRWYTDRYGEVRPLEFIPIIEELHLHEKFSLAVVERTMIEYPDLIQKYGKGIRVAVNISPACLLSHTFAFDVIRLLKKYQFYPENLTLEITEDVVIEGVETVNKRLTPLRSMGVKISLDDFGTGFSALSYLPRLEIDEIKLDKSLIDQILISEKSRTLVASLIQLSDEYGFNIVAEGVETSAQYETLVKMGCAMIQGFYIGEAEPAI
ncbi:MAG: EAL domain-containing protein [Lachnospiraceae bacterium]|nr:EAL domain-containing protein [Lachnospiraceae bacterium]